MPTIVRIREALDAASVGEKTSIDYGKVRPTPVRTPKDASTIGDDAWLTRDFFTGRVKVAGQICARLDLSPIAGSEVTRVILQQEYGLGTIEEPIPDGIHRMAQALTV